jgi:3-oxoacyl-[acyl-carrier protein] reductase
MKRYQEINVGDKQTLSHVITKVDIGKFVELTGDDNKLHVDEKFASTTHFKKPVVHGMLGASFISTIIGTKLPGDGALWFSQTLEFLLPVRIGDHLTVIAEVIKKNDKEQIIELKTEIYNQNKQIVTKGIAKVKVIEQEVPLEASIENKETRVKTALVIGGTGGIGSEVCLQLAKDGFNIALHYNSNIDKATELKKIIIEQGVKCIIINANINIESELKDMLTMIQRTFNTIDVLVNAAASNIPSVKFQDLEWSDYLKQLELNIKSVFNIMKIVVELMVNNGGGKIINIGSYSAEKPNNDWSHYITAKSALIGLTKSLAFELAPKGININMVTPSLVSTELTADIPEKFKLLTASQTPLRRLAKASDVAGAISFLASEKANFLAGENIRINGGQIML